jgi:hypothetical protein
MGADADLDGTVGIDDALLDSMRDEGAVADAGARPGILMRVELHQRQRSVHGRVRLQ